MALRSAILKFKFVHRAISAPASTLLRAIVTCFLMEEVISTDTVNGQTTTTLIINDDEWKKMQNNILWQDHKILTNQYPLPRDSVAFIVAAHQKIEMENRRTAKPAVARARHARIWDPILYLPATRLQRHRLIKWRTHWLPSFPPKDCRCGFKKAKRDHYEFCPMLAIMIQQLEQSIGTNKLSTKAPDQHILDFIINMLPTSEIGLTRGHWRTTWPTLLNTLRDIDILTHSEEEFEPERPAARLNH
ncbi:hypothetical protein INT45_011546 [Circinella minor]|uniref:Uncharacterized protein n=1 Tax=Circinella minor TaxID=1195481 RepID=A0A8H7S6U5_9FUNG|nr:hypothetical protein INT45_011546 [Circinella minor]